MTVPAQI